jgi:hypothetical protein
MGSMRRSAIAVVGVTLALGGIVATAESAAAKLATPLSGPVVTGKLSSGGYKIAAVGFNGKMTISAHRQFSFRAPESEYTLQLLASNGRYAGPVVVGGTSSKVALGLKDSVKLGAIDIVAKKGYGHTTKAAPKAHIVTSRWAYAKNGVPIGNGLNLGLVRSKGTGGGTGPGDDEAHVGIPNELDIAVPGTLTLKSLAPVRASGVKRALSARFASQAPIGPPPASADPWMSQLFLPMNETVNDDASGITKADIDQALKSNLDLKLLQIPSGSLVELDCNGLSYCSPGGTGQAQLEGEPVGGGNSGCQGLNYLCQVPFPSATVDPSSGYGEIVGPNAPADLLGDDANGGHEFSLVPGATSSQIGSGDVITEVVTNAGTTTETPTTLDFVFSTVPAIASYSDTAGDSGAITYPDTSGLGTGQNPIEVAAGSNGDAVVTFKIWRPQRAGVPGAGEPALMDIGNLWYALDSASGPSQGQVGSATAPQCSAASYSNLSPTLSLEGSGSGQDFAPAGDGSLVDSASDAPASAANTISFTVDITQCLTDHGTPFPVGQPMQFDISANSQSSSDHANQTFWLERTS